MQATGPFDVSLTPAAAEAAGGHAQVHRLVIAKHYHGDLEATSGGQMLAVRTAVNESAGYVALEYVSGSLAGRTGSFALQHTGTMDRGNASLSVSVVPDSGTEQLVGLTGTMTIENDHGRHSYAFTYTLPEV